MVMNKQKRKWMKPAIIVAVIVLILGGLAAGMSKSTPVHTARLSQGVIHRYVEERARTTLPHVYHLTMPEAGRVRPITLAEGTPVTNGQIVVTLEKSDLQDALFESHSIVTAMVNAVQASQAQIEAGLARKNYAEWLRDAQSNLFAKAQTSELESKKAERDFLEADVDVQESTSHAYAMQALLAVCRIMPIYVNRQLKRTELASPVDGIVLKRYLWNEQVMQPGDLLMDIGNLDDLQITADVLTEEAVTIHPGDAVEIYGEAIGDTPIQGKVLRVKPQAFTKLSSLGVEQQRVAVEIAFDPEALQHLADAKQKLGLEYRVQVRIYTETQQDALIIPRTALFRSDDGQWQVFRILGGHAKTVTLKLGIVNDAQAQVLEGLQSDDTVIIAPDATLKDGMRVTGR